MTKYYRILQNNTKVAELSIDIAGNYSNIEWNSENGLVTAKINGTRQAIPHKGTPLVKISPTLPTTIEKSDDGITWETDEDAVLYYRYWYY